MQYRCYACGFKLGTGMPPVEALSAAQNQLVGAEDDLQRHDVLRNTKFEGMSTYSFCTFCLLVLQMAEGTWDIREKYYDEVVNLPTDYGTMEWTYKGRLMSLMAARDMYQNIDHSLLESLITADFNQNICSTCFSSWWSEIPSEECHDCRRVRLSYPCSDCGEAITCGELCYECAVAADEKLAQERWGRSSDPDFCSCCNFLIHDSGDCACTIGACEYCEDED